MSGPWEDYAQSEPGPWEDFGGRTSKAPEPPLVNDSTWAKNRDKFISETGTLPTRVKEAVKNIGRNIAPMARPVLEGGGAILGGVLATPETAGLGTVAGAGLGYAAGARLADLIEGKQTTPQAATMQSLKDIATGATYEMGGQAAIPAVSIAAKGIGYVAKPLLGKLSGVGPGAIEEALKSGVNAKPSINPIKSKTAFDNALRGNISGEEIVDNTRGALNVLKEQRATAYQAKLSQVGQSTATVNDAPIMQTLADKMRNFRVRIVAGTKNGQPYQTVDTSQAAMGKAGRNDIKDTIEEIINWKDKSPLGMDALKRRLDDFYSDSSQARNFVASLRDSVRQSIVDAVPAYDEMTKGYSEATKLVKDVEADLMLRKNGMSGRITADKTLRRLTSAMRDNFEMRKELVDILGAKGGEDLSGQIAGYTMRTPIPRGLAGTGPVLSGSAYLTYLNPKFWPLLAASSPRVQGEFLRVFGKGMSAAKSVGPKGTKAVVMQSAISAKDSSKEE